MTKVSPNIDFTIPLDIDSFDFIDVQAKNAAAKTKLSDLLEELGELLSVGRDALDDAGSQSPFLQPDEDFLSTPREGNGIPIGNDESDTISLNVQPDATPFLTDSNPVSSVPDWAQGTSFSSTLPIEWPVFNGRGGNPGPPDRSGGDDGTGDGDTTTDPTVLAATYTSGDVDTLSYDFFNIRIEFYGNLWTSEFYEAFVASADLLSTLIVQGLPEDSYLGSYYETSQTERIADDIVIEAYLSDIDGSGNVLGQAGPTYARSSDGSTVDGLPVAGFMEFDIADAADLVGLNLWDDTVFHEMVHVLGFGTLWDFEAWNLVGDQLILINDNGTRRPTDDVTGYAYLGSEANSVYGSDTDYLVVEAGGGSGTARGHWSEDVHGNEIMTGYINSTNYIGDFSVAALADLGYDIASNYADLINPYSSDIALTSTNVVQEFLA